MTQILVFPHVDTFKLITINFKCFLVCLITQKPRAFLFTFWLVYIEMSVEFIANHVNETSKLFMFFGGKKKFVKFSLIVCWLKQQFSTWCHCMLPTTTTKRNKINRQTMIPWMFMGVYVCCVCVKNFSEKIIFFLLLLVVSVGI